MQHQTLSEMFKHYVDERIRYLRGVYHVLQLRLVLGHHYRSAGDSRDHSALRPSSIRSQLDHKAAIKSTGHAENEVMPHLVPQREGLCIYGHKLFFRTVPLPDCENVRAMGCDGNECPQSLLVLLRAMTSRYGAETGPSSRPAGCTCHIAWVVTDGGHPKVQLDCPIHGCLPPAI